MNLNDLLFLSIPAALAAFKLTLIALAVVYAVKTLFSPQRLMAKAEIKPVRSPTRSFSGLN